MSKTTTVDVRISRVRRVATSSKNNPTCEIVTANGHVYRTSVNSMAGYAAPNFEPMRPDLVKSATLSLTPAGRVFGIVAGPALKAGEEERTDAEWAEARLRTLAPRGTVLTTIVRYVSRSGMQRAIQIVAVDRDGELVDLTFYLVRLGIGKSHPTSPGLKVNGCGMDMSWHTVHRLAEILYGDGDALTQRSL